MVDTRFTYVTFIMAQCERWDRATFHTCTYILFVYFPMWKLAVCSLSFAINSLLDIGLPLFVPVITVLNYPHPWTTGEGNNIIYPFWRLCVNIHIACFWSPVITNLTPIMVTSCCQVLCGCPTWFQFHNSPNYVVHRCTFTNIDSWNSVNVFLVSLF